MNSNRISKWKEFLHRNEPLDDSLPLMHTTRAYSFDSILKDDTIYPNYCEVFRENLVYLYYGRPAYRARQGVNAKLEFDWPIAFILHPDKAVDIDRIFPFDTGAFARGIYNDFFDKKSKIEDFESGCRLDDARLIVGALYSSNNEYYCGGTRHNVQLRLREFEAQGVHELARLPGNPAMATSGHRDERSSTIELQTRKPIELEDAILAIVLPHPYLGDEEVREKLAQWGVSTIRSYQTLDNTNSDVWIGQIYQIVHEILTENGFLALE